jgi:hypothetical protein
MLGANHFQHFLAHHCRRSLRGPQVPPPTEPESRCVSTLLVKRQPLLTLRGPLISAIPLGSIHMPRRRRLLPQLDSDRAAGALSGYRRAIRLQRNAHAALCSADTRSSEGAHLSPAEGGRLPGESSDGHLGAPRNRKTCNQTFSSSVPDTFLAVREHTFNFDYMCLFCFRH